LWHLIRISGEGHNWCAGIGDELHRLGKELLKEAPKTVAEVKGTPKQALFAATMGFFVGFAAVALFGPTASRFQDVMHLSPVMVGFLVAAPALSGSLLRIPFSAWVDTTGGRNHFSFSWSFR